MPPAPTPTATGSEFRLSWIDHPALPAHGLGLCRCPGSRDGVRVPPSCFGSREGTELHCRETCTESYLLWRFWREGWIFNKTLQM